MTAAPIVKHTGGFHMHQANLAMHPLWTMFMDGALLHIVICAKPAEGNYVLLCGC